ncbi:SDR family NAD(P)-dependent oxidoreductase [Kiritimatiellaeota bacterium B1221]|nr:SDR family NAD(P)-dependent oxidoreductase [Kiritimatiellaeota bacterium B1221]
MKDLKEKVVVITGASSGIGAAAAAQFVALGCKVVLMSRTLEKLEAVAAPLKEKGSVQCVAADVCDEASVAKAFGAIGPVDILVNNAGVGFATDLSSCTLEDYRAIMETNVTGVFLCSRAVLPGMKSRTAGHIVNVSSVVGKVANPGAPLYCASKHGLNGYSSGLQQQVAKDGIGVSMVSPSAVDTAYWDGRDIDRSKFLQPEEVASAIVFVVSQPAGVLIKDIDLTAMR